MRWKRALEDKQTQTVFSKAKWKTEEKKDGELHHTVQSWTSTWATYSIYFYNVSRVCSCDVFKFYIYVKMRLTIAEREMRTTFFVCFPLVWLHDFRWLTVCTVSCSASGPLWESICSSVSLMCQSRRMACACIRVSFFSLWRTWLYRACIFYTLFTEMYVVVGGGGLQKLVKQKEKMHINIYIYTYCTNFNFRGLKEY